MPVFRNIIATLLLAFPLPVLASHYECTITDVLKLTDNGSFAGHAWSNMYKNRKFFFDSDSGKVTGTTALKVRLSNYNSSDVPEVLRGDTYQAITLFRDTGRYAVVQIDTAIEGPDKPFFYRTAIGMFLTGTCVTSAD